MRTHRTHGWDTADTCAGTGGHDDVSGGRGLPGSWEHALAHLVRAVQASPIRGIAATPNRSLSGGRTTLPTDQLPCNGRPPGRLPRPEVVRSLVLLEPCLVVGASAQNFRESLAQWTGWLRFVAVLAQSQRQVEQRKQVRPYEAVQLSNTVPVERQDLNCLWCIPVAIWRTTVETERWLSVCTCLPRCGR